MSRIDRVLEEARSWLTRLSARDVPEVLERGALLVDIRPQAQREREGDELHGQAVRNALASRISGRSESEFLASAARLSKCLRALATSPVALAAVAAP